MNRPFLDTLKLSQPNSNVEQILSSPSTKCADRCSHARRRLVLHVESKDFLWMSDGQCREHFCRPGKTVNTSLAEWIRSPLRLVRSWIQTLAPEYSLLKFLLWFSQCFRGFQGFLKV